MNMWIRMMRNVQLHVIQSGLLVGPGAWRGVEVFRLLNGGSRVTLHKDCCYAVHLSIVVLMNENTLQKPCSLCCSCFTFHGCSCSLISSRHPHSHHLDGSSALTIPSSITVSTFPNSHQGTSPIGIIVPRFVIPKNLKLQRNKLNVEGDCIIRAAIAQMLVLKNGKAKLCHALGRPPRRLVNIRTPALPRLP